MVVVEIGVAVFASSPATDGLVADELASACADVEGNEEMEPSALGVGTAVTGVSLFSALVSTATTEGPSSLLLLLVVVEIGRAHV